MIRRNVDVIAIGVLLGGMLMQSCLRDFIQHEKVVLQQIAASRTRCLLWVTTDCQMPAPPPVPPLPSL